MSSRQNQVTKAGKPLKLVYTPIQNQVFSDPHRYVVFAKGRRCGGTYGAALFCIESLAHKKKILWVDTIQSNLSKYIERYFYPLLSFMEKDLWDWNEQKKCLKFANGGYMDMRSAEKPENIEGFAYDLIIMNEAGIIFNDNDYLWYNSIYPMTLDYHSQCFFIGTPKGKLSKSGKEHLYYTFFKKGLEETGDWKSYQFSSYRNPKLSREDIKSLEDEVPVLIKRQEIHAEFIDVSLDSIFVEDWFTVCKTGIPAGTDVVRRIISWDTAFKDKESNDYSVATVWVQTLHKFVCIDMVMERLTFPKLIKKTWELYDRYKPDVIVVEDKASGQSLIQMFKESTLPVVAYKIDRDKVARAVAITPLLSEGKCEFIDAGWLTVLRNQCVLFPLGEFDDAVDSLSQALLYLTQGTVWSKDRTPISRKMVRNSSDLNGYDGDVEKVPVEITSVNSYGPPVYLQPAHPVKDTILQGY